MFIGCAGAAAMLLTDFKFQPIIERAIGALIVLGTPGLLLSVILARFVRCKSCGEQAMVYPDSQPITPETEMLHQPWRHKCGWCGAKIE